MCGFAGVLTEDAAAGADARNCLRAMTAALVHRGPDAEGLWSDGGIGLGHRRLSILDLSDAGAQPMHSDCGRHVIAFNGEIYNHLDLRAELGAAGAAPAWRGHSDTETLLAGVVHWGIDATLSRSKGMFALALWDRLLRKLVLARDRVGEKPLYWGWAGPVLVFGSELKALRQHPGFPRAICPDALKLYLGFSYVPAPRSIHPGVYKLEPGCVIEVDGTVPTTPPAVPLRPGDRHGNLSVRRYWSLDAVIAAGARNPVPDDGEAVIALEQALSNAVGRQMIADVPLGAFLSGGIDSSLVVALMQRHATRPVRTFTIGFENAAYNEAPCAAAVARHLGTDHSETIVTDADARRVIPLLPELYDEPFGDSSQIPTHLVARMARAHVTVALSGDAGDELFGGYNRYLWGPHIWRRLGWMPMPLRRVLGSAIVTVPIPVWDGLGRLGGRRLSVARPGDKAHKLAERLRSVRGMDDLYLSLVSEWTGAALVSGPQPASILDDPLPVALDGDPAGRMMAQDMRSYLPDDILCKVDRAAMGVGLETRVPFLDPDVIGLSARLPPRMKIRDGQGKWALRQVLYRHVPRQLVERPKTGFGIPVGDWLRGPLRAWADDLLSAEALGRDGLIDPAPVRAAWAEHLSGRRDWTHRLWIVLMLQAWRVRWT